MSEASILAAEPTAGRPAEPGAFRRLLSRPTVAIAAVFLAMLVVVGLFAPLIPGLDPDEVYLSNVLDMPSWGHWLGYDNIGRDVFSRLIYASRVSLGAAAIAMLVALALGLPLGLISGYFAGRVDLVLSRAVDCLLAFPPLLLAIVIVSVLRPGLVPAMIAIGIVNTPTFFRVVRSAVLALRNETYIEAARISGSSVPRILLRHILPNIRGVLLVQITLTMSSAIIVEASLSFIGLGVQLPQASWGSMLRQASSFLGSAPPTFVLSPAAIVILVVLSFNTLSDGLRNVLAGKPGTAP